MTQREQNKKNVMATIFIKSYTIDEKLIIEIKDDGKGINPQIISKLAIEKGFVSEDSIKDYDDNKLINLITLPNFSTKSEVTSLSGRGVGMDAVKQFLESVGGNLVIQSEIDIGTTMTISL